MNSSAKLAVALGLGAAVGGVAMHQLHAQAKPPVYMVAINEIINQDGYLKESLLTDHHQALP